MKCTPSLQGTNHEKRLINNYQNDRSSMPLGVYLMITLFSLYSREIDDLTII